MSLERLKARWAVHNKQPEITTLKCNVCFHDSNVSNFKIYKSQDIFHAGELVRYQCPNCDLIFGDLRFLGLSSEEIGNDYIDLYSCYSEGDSNPIILHYLIDVLKIPKDKTYLDYACGKSCDYLRKLSQDGYNIKGYDKYVTSDNPHVLQTLSDSDQFDCVISNSYIEHVINPYEDLQSILKHVKPGGQVIFTTDCFEYNIEFTHYHTYFFVGRSISYLEKNLKIKLVDSHKNIRVFQKFNTI